MKTIDRRVKELRQAVLDTMNRYGQPLSVDELVLENILQAVRMQMQQDTGDESDESKPDPNQ